MSLKDLNVILELEKVTEDQSNEMFYRYAVGGFKLWFAQNVENGNVYSVGLKSQDDMFDDFYLYVSANEEAGGGYYPNSFSFSGRSSNMTTEVARKYMQNMEHVCAVLDKVEEFFKTSKHYELYSKFHPLEKSFDDMLKDATARSVENNTGIAGKSDVEIKSDI